METTELHEVKKVVFIEADTKAEAIKYAKRNERVDAESDENTGHIAKIKVDMVEEIIPNPHR
tara:strand:+ start:723 stop:908 length:186 start_codon:yes stop_codon:yes gene_type:complete